MHTIQPLSRLSPGQTAKISHLQTEGAMRRRLLDLGLVRDTVVHCVGRSPAGDPSAYLIRGAVIAIRAVDGEQIFVGEG